MTINTLKINGKDLNTLNSKETTDLVRALLAHRKTLNTAAREARQAKRDELVAARAERKAAQIAKLTAKLEKLAA